MKTWLIESLGTRKSYPPLNYFSYDDDIGILDMFRVVGPKLSLEARSILINSIEASLLDEAAEQNQDTFFLYSMMRLLEGLGDQKGCEKAYRALAVRFNKFICNLDLSDNSTISDIVDYRDALDFCLDIAFRVVQNCIEIDSSWKNLDPDSPKSKNLFQTIKTITPILNHAEHTFKKLSSQQSIHVGLNIAYIQLVMLSTLKIALDVPVYNILEKAEPLWSMVEDKQQYKYELISHSEVDLFPHPKDKNLFGPYNLQRFRHKMLEIVLSLIEKSAVLTRPSKIIDTPQFMSYKDPVTSQLAQDVLLVLAINKHDADIYLF